MVGLTIFVHASLQALLQPAGPALVSMSFVNRTASIPRFADVLPISSYRSLKCTNITSWNGVKFQIYSWMDIEMLVLC